MKVGPRTVVNTAQLLAAVAALPPDSDTTLGLQRGSQALDVTVRGAATKAVARGGAESGAAAADRSARNRRVRRRVSPAGWSGLLLGNRRRRAPGGGMNTPGGRCPVR